MRFAVLLQRGSRDVRGTADVALVGFDVLVNLLVDEHVRAMGERFAAEATLVVLNAPMDVHMFLKLVGVSERFRAFIAPIFADFLMDDFDVVLEDGGRCKFPCALLAMVKLIVIAVVRPHESI